MPRCAAPGGRQRPGEGDARRDLLQLREADPGALRPDGRPPRLLSGLLPDRGQAVGQAEIDPSGGTANRPMITAMSAKVAYADSNSAFECHPRQNHGSP